MKKIFSCMCLTLILCSFVSCQNVNTTESIIGTMPGATIAATTEQHSNTTDHQAINRAITYIQANELQNALNECKAMNRKTIEAGTENILASILINLEYYRDTSVITKENQYLVNPRMMEKIKIYDEILSLLSLDKVFTNAKTFTEKLLKLEPYMEWNEYYASLDKDSLQEIENYMNQGKTYRNSSWSIAVTYYEKAYTTANNAYYHFKGKSGKGMKECADFYKSYAVLIDRIINRENITDAESKAYDSAIDNYMNALKDMSNALDDVIAILDSFPAKLY